MKSPELSCKNVHVTFVCYTRELSNLRRYCTSAISGCFISSNIFCKNVTLTAKFCSHRKAYTPGILQCRKIFHLRSMKKGSRHKGELNVKIIVLSTQRDQQARQERKTVHHFDLLSLCLMSFVQVIFFCFSHLCSSFPSWQVKPGFFSHMHLPFEVSLQWSELVLVFYGYTYFLLSTNPMRKWGCLKVPVSYPVILLQLVLHHRSQMTAES